MFSATSQPEASSFLLGPGPPIVTGDSERGPPGCNLFVFHLPNELTNWDLYLLFRKFGTIVSVHTMINKNTGLSRGFGFVSFSKEEEAIAAVRSMDGFRLGKKRLKVQRKREHEEDCDGFGPDFESLCAYGGFPSTSSTVDQSTPPVSSTNTPRYGAACVSPLSQTQTPQRFDSPSSSVLNAVIPARLNPLSTLFAPGISSNGVPAQRGDNLYRTPVLTGHTSSVDNPEANLHQSFMKDCRLSESIFGDCFPKPFPTGSNRTIPCRPQQRAQSFCGDYASSDQQNLPEKSAFGRYSIDGDTGNVGMGVNVNLGSHLEASRSSLLSVQNDRSAHASPIIRREDRVRERRNSDDSFFFSQRLDYLCEEATTSPPPMRSLPPTPKLPPQFYDQIYQQQQYQQQHREDRQQGAQQAEYENERRERSRSGSTTGSQSTDGKTSMDVSEEDHCIKADKARDGASNEEQHHESQHHYTYDNNLGKYVLR